MLYIPTAAFNTIIQFSDDTATDTRIRLFWTPISTVFSISGDEVGMVVAYRIWCSVRDMYYPCCIHGGMALTFRVHVTSCCYLLNQ